MQRIEMDAANEVKKHQESKKKQIRDTFNMEVEGKVARLITKAELEELYPTGTFERYSLVSLNKFRQDIMKAEGVEGNKDEIFKAATKGLQSFVVEGEGKDKAIVFVRKKEAGE